MRERKSLSTVKKTEQELKKKRANVREVTDAVNDGSIAVLCVMEGKRWMETATFISLLSQKLLPLNDKSSLSL